MTNQEDLKVKDLLRAGTLRVPETLGLALAARLMERMWRRPAGAGPRTFAKMGMTDPFARPGDAPDLHKPIYVAGRFVRIDKAEVENNPRAAVEALKKTAAGAPTAAPPQQAQGGDRNAERQRKLMEIREALKRKNEDPGPSSSGPVYAAGRTPPKPKGPATALAPEDRSIPKLPPPGQQSRATASGRLRGTAPTHSRQRVVQGGTPPGGMPPVITPTHDTSSSFASDTRRQPVYKVPEPAAPPQVAAPPPKPAAPPPAKRHVEGTTRPEGIRPAAPAARPAPQAPAPQAPAPQAPAPPPARPAPPPEAAPAPAKTAPALNRTPPKGSDGGLDDLFGGMQEGRVRIGRRSGKKKTEPEG
ncbi:MAG: hypothetical protein JXX28_04355 [Deltaproteobacteria bacterium]|nr:hypothetical protein [Deltaproteobacteria bacterium]